MLGFAKKFTPLPNILTILFQHFNYDEQLQEPLTPVIILHPDFQDNVVLIMDYKHRYKTR
jgi:hypothetical protein